MLNIAILGYGRIGREHAAWIRAAHLPITAVYDPTPARRALAHADGLPTVNSPHAAFDRAHAVLVATPTSLHTDHTLAALAAGKHVMVEKPMALRLAPALAMRDAAHAARRTLSVFHCRRWDQDFLSVKALLASGTLGHVFNLESRLGQFASCVGPAAPEYRPQWRTESAFGGGGLYDWGSHFLDQLQLLLAPARPVRVFAQLRPVLWSADCDDFARVLVDFDNGAHALCEINTVTTRPLPRWHLDGTLGSASSPPSPTFDTAVWAQLTATAPDGRSLSLPPPTARLTEPQIWAAFARACLDQSPPPIPLDSVLPTMQLLDAALTSSHTGHAVPLPPIPA